MDNATTVSSFAHLNKAALAFNAETAQGDRSLTGQKARGSSCFRTRPGRKASSKKFGIEIGFSIIENIKMDAACAYGMEHPGAADTQDVRAIFFIAPNGIPHAKVYRLMRNGRSIDEFVRLQQAVHTSDKNAIATPEGWTPICGAIVPPPKITEALTNHTVEGCKTVDSGCSTPAL